MHWGYWRVGKLRGCGTLFSSKGDGMRIEVTCSEFPEEKTYVPESEVIPTSVEPVNWKWTRRYRESKAHTEPVYLTKYNVPNRTAKNLEGRAGASEARVWDQRWDQGDKAKETIGREIWRMTWWVPYELSSRWSLCISSPTHLFFFSSLYNGEQLHSQTGCPSQKCRNLT